MLALLSTVKGSHLRFIVAIALVLASVHAQAGNSGVSAQGCVTARSEAVGKVTFTNRCGEKVFVMWCGELGHSRERCGDAPDRGYYTHTDNIPAGESRTTSIKGRYSFAACKGSVGFGKKGFWEDYPNGGYTCLRN
jgi:hypothetical protein